ncbi:MAG: acyltransferase family protein [Clostridiales bacterium]|nr:acyltransferase family protein [Clostridiales bacterium]
MKRDSVIDIMKGILIVFVVMGHAQIPLHRFIYLFHMPVFFMISGYLWNEAHTRIGISQLVLKRIKSLYIPFVVCNLFFLILHLCIPGIMETQTVETSATGILKSVFKVLIFRGRATLSDSTWFLSTLFFATIGYAIILIISMKVGKKNNRVENMVANGVIVVIYAIGCVLAYYDINVYEIGTICVAIALLHLGRFIFIHREIIVAPLNKGYSSNIIVILASGVLGILLFIANEEIRMI